MLWHCPYLYLNQPFLHPHNQVNCAIPMAWFLAPINGCNIFKEITKRSHNFILISYVCCDQTAARNILNLRETYAFAAQFLNNGCSGLGRPSRRFQQQLPPNRFDYDFVSRRIQTTVLIQHSQVSFFNLTFLQTFT